jgi:hypothetical protein
MTNIHVLNRLAGVVNPEVLAAIEAGALTLNNGKVEMVAVGPSGWDQVRGQASASLQKLNVPVRFV